MKNKAYHTVGTAPKSTSQAVEIDTHRNKYITKCGGFKLI